MSMTIRLRVRRADSGFFGREAGFSPTGSAGGAARHVSPPPAHRRVHCVRRVGLRLRRRRYSRTPGASCSALIILGSREPASAGGRGFAPPDGVARSGDWVRGGRRASDAVPAGARWGFRRDETRRPVVGRSGDVHHPDLTG